MTNSSRTLLISIALFVMGGAVPAISEAKGPPVREILVDEAIPSFAEDGEGVKPLVVKGRNFPSHVKVRFIFEGGEGDGGITTIEDVISASSKSELRFNINVPDGAGIGGYNIEVQEFDIASGLPTDRKGKGTTTLFNVKTANKTTYSCAEVFGAPDFPSPTNCDCIFTLSESTSNIMNPIGSCETFETLYMGQYQITTGTDVTITAKGPFTGDAVIASSHANAGFRGVNIHIDASIKVAEAGCGGDKLNSFIKFVMDENTHEANANSQHLVDFHTLTAAPGVAVCHAIELSHYQPDFDQNGYLDWKMDVDDNVIADGTYIKTGILFRGFGPLPGRLGRLSVSNNTIGTPAAGANAELANGIQFGPGYGPGTVERNNIKSSGGTGILVLGGDDDAMEMTVGHNDVEGALISILVDDNVPSSQITSNYLVGDGDPATDDIGICQQSSNKTKPNKFVNLSSDLSVVTHGVVCNPGPDVPAAW